MVKQPVIIYLLQLSYRKKSKHLSLDNYSCELLDSQSQIWPSRFFSGKQDQRVGLTLTFWASIWRKTILQASRISKLAAIIDDTEIKRTYMYRLYEQFPNIRGFPGFSGNSLMCANSGYQATLFFCVAWVRGYHTGNPVSDEDPVRVENICAIEVQKFPRQPGDGQFFSLCGNPV